MTAPLLTAENVSVKFQGIVAVDDASIQVAPGAIFGLLGPNGAGKTTFLNVISGVCPPSAGRVLLEGRDISRMPLHKRVSSGIGRTYQGVELFADLSVQDNLMIGRHHLMRSSLVGAGIFWGWSQKEEAYHREKVEEVIRFFEIERFRKSKVSNLGYGTQKIIGLARAMAGEPRILLLDEVAAGLNREEKENLARFMLRIKHAFGIAIIWVEHDVGMVADLVDQVAVLNFGRVIAVGDPGQVFNDAGVKRAFVGQVNSAEQATRIVQAE